MLKQQIVFIARPFLVTLKRPQQFQEAPEDWKIANVTPIFKKNKKENPGNSRPFSLTLFPGKVRNNQSLPPFPGT